MATAVKMDEETRSTLEELQADSKLRTGKEATQQEILAQRVASAANSRTAFIDSFRDAPTSLSEAGLARFNEGRIASDGETDEDDIDDVLYG
jgi:hypothetical protein